MNVLLFFKLDIIDKNIAMFGEWELKFRATPKAPELQSHMLPLCYFYQSALDLQGLLDQAKRKEISEFIRDEGFQILCNSNDELCRKLLDLGFVISPDPEAKIAEVKYYRKFSNVRVTFGREQPQTQRSRESGRTKAWSGKFSWQP